MKKLSRAIIEVLVKRFSQDGKTYRDIQKAIEIEGFKRPSLGFISKILGVRRAGIKKVL